MIFLDKLLNDEKLKLKTVNIWSFNGGKFDYLFLLNELIEKYPEIKTVGTDTDMK